MKNMKNDGGNLNLLDKREDFMSKVNENDKIWLQTLQDLKMTLLST